MLKLRSRYTLLVLLFAFAGISMAGWLEVHGQRPRLKPVRRDYLAGKFLLIPPDSRSVSVQMPRLIARLADHDLVLPPNDLLGDASREGDPDRLAEWARNADYADVEGVIVSLEMLGQGGPQGREVEEAKVRGRLAVIDSMRARRKTLPIYGLATDGSKLSAIGIEMTASGRLDYLLIGRSESPASEGESGSRPSPDLAEQIARRGLSSRITITAGMEAGPQLLVGRLLNHRFGLTPKFWIGTSRSPHAAGLAAMVLSQITALDGQTLPGTPDAAARSDVVLLVNAPGTEEEGSATLLETAATAISRGFRVSLADLAEDIDSRKSLIGNLRRRKMLDQMIAYSGSVPPEAACASVLAQATSRLVMMKFLRDDVDRLQRAERAQVELMLIRVIADISYPSVVRPKLEVFLRDQLKADPRRLGTAREQVESFAREEVTRLGEEIFREQFFRNTHSILLATGERAVFDLRALQRIQLRFSWGTTDDVELRAGVYLPLVSIVPPDGGNRASWELLDPEPLDGRLVRRFDSVAWPRFKTDVEQVSIQVNLNRRELPSEGYSIQSRRRSRVTRRIEISSSSAAGAFYALSRLEQLGIEGRLAEDFVLTENPAFSLRGVMESADGVPWSHRDRLDMIRFLGRVKMNRYYLTPPGEPLLHEKWREPFGEGDLDRMKELVLAGEESFVSVACGVRLGHTIDYANDDDFRLLMAKAIALRSVGIRNILLAFEDRTERETKAEGHDRVKALAGAQARLANRVYEQLQKNGETVNLSVIPAVVSGSDSGSDYLRALDAALGESVTIVWPLEEAPGSARSGGAGWHNLTRHRPILLDSFPNNDGIDWRPFLGALSPNLADRAEESGGFIGGSMSQAHVSMLPIATVADYLWDPRAYNAAHSLDRALKLMFDDRSAAGMKQWSDFFKENRWHRHLFEPLFRRQSGEVDVPEIERSLSSLEGALENLGMERESGLTRAELSYFIRRTRIALRRLINDPAYERQPDMKYRLRAD